MLIYNWAQFDNAELLGGGVSVYLKRLIPELVRQGLEIVFLSASSDASKRCKIIPSENCFSALGVCSYSLANPNVPYPHNAAFGADGLVDDQQVIQVLEKFILDVTPDVVHFHSIEGIPASALRLKQTFPDIKWWFTAHNYHLVCQQIQLFQKGRGRNCQDYLNGEACRTCDWQDFDNISTRGLLEHRVPKSKKLFAGIEKIKRLLPSQHANRQETDAPIQTVDDTWLRRAPRQSADYFFDWRQYNIKSVLENFDGVLAVSKLQRDLLSQAGLDPQKVEVLNPPVSDQEFDKAIIQQKEISTISYWGYANPSTGLSLFIDALELLVHRYSETKSLSVLIVSDTGRRFRDRLALIEPHFNEIQIVKRYDQQTMKSLAARVDLAVIAPLWRETYCQVAAELFFLGVPVLASSTLGFAGEHINDDRFVFESRSEFSLVEHLRHLLEQPNIVAEYWNSTEQPPLIQTHSNRLISAYRK